MKLNNAEKYDPLHVVLDPIGHKTVYDIKLRELIEESGMTEEEARSFLLQPIELELYYDYGVGLFAVESEAVEASCEIYNPYDGKEMEAFEEEEDG